MSTYFQENVSTLSIKRASVTQSALRVCVFVLKQFLAFGWRVYRTFRVFFPLVVPSENMLLEKTTLNLTL